MKSKKTKEFCKNYDLVINEIIDKLEAKDVREELEIDYEMFVLKINTKNGCFILNRQITLFEIWLSSPVSGPYHFRSNISDNKIENWIDKNGKKLKNIIFNEVLPH